MKAFIVDDEAPARRRLARLLATQPGLEIVGEAGDGMTALEAIARLQPEVVFLDVEMPELDGFGVAEALPTDGPSIVFVTAYDEYALRAFETAAVDYLVKPVAEKRLAATLDRLRSRLRARPGHREDFESQGKLDQLLREVLGNQPARRLAVRSGSRYLVFDPALCIAIVARDHYAAILIEGRELLCDDSLEVLQSRLGADRFFRVHRSALVNLDYLEALECQGDRKYVAVLSDAEHTRLPISRERLPEVKRRLGLA